MYIYAIFVTTTRSYVYPKLRRLVNGIDLKCVFEKFWLMAAEMAN